jgi:hypothetical protein
MANNNKINTFMFQYRFYMWNFARVKHFRTWNLQQTYNILLGLRSFLKWQKVDFSGHYAVCMCIPTLNFCTNWPIFTKFWVNIIWLEATSLSSFWFPTVSNNSLLDKGNFEGGVTLQMLNIGSWNIGIRLSRRYATLSGMSLLWNEKNVANCANFSSKF